MTDVSEQSVADGPNAEDLMRLLEAVYAAREFLGWIPEDQISVERNELRLDDYQSGIGNHSYLEQVHLWEVQPGEGEPLRQAIISLPLLLNELHKRVAGEYAAALLAAPRAGEGVDRG